jgi:capsular exopolysaccharide synthesis family protein
VVRRTPVSAHLVEGVRVQDAASEPAPESGLPPNLLEYARRLIKHRWAIAGAMVACLAAGAAITFLTPPAYTASTTLQIDRESAKVLNVEAVTPSEQLVSAEEFFQTQYGLLRSEALSDRVIDQLGLASSTDFVKAMGKTPKGAPGQPLLRDQVAKLVHDNIGIIPTRGSRLVAVTFTSPDPRLSARVANAFADGFIQANLDRRFQSASYARQFLETRLAQTKAKLEQQERDLVAYATRQQIIQLHDAGPGAAPGSEQSLPTADLEALNAAYARAKADRIVAEQRWREASGAQGNDLPDVLQNPTIQQLTQARAQKTAEYENKLRLFQADYPEMRQLKAQIDELNRQIGVETARVRNSFKGQYEIALNNERQLQGQVGQLKGAVLDLKNRSIQYTILQREVDTSRALYDGLLQRYKEVGVAGGVTSNNISIVDQAKPPRIPSEPKPVRNMALALLAGAVLGLALATLMEALDQAVRNPRDVEAKLRLPALGAIPILDRGLQPREALNDTRAPISEAYFSLRSALQFSTADGFPRSLLVTSTRTGEGKSTTAFALAQSVARLGFRVLLVDGDLRNPSLHKTLGLDNHRGLSNLLTGAATLGEVTQETQTQHLSVIAAGPLPPNPAELLASARLGAFLAGAVQEFDTVIVDGPPVLGLADAPLISALVTGVVLVVESGSVARAQVLAALRRLQMVNAHILGVVLTKFSAKTASYGYGYGYEYEYEYGPRDGAPAAGQGGLSRLTREARKLMSR